MDFIWSDFAQFGLCLLIIALTVIAYLLGCQLGKLKERKRQLRERWVRQKSRLYMMRQALRQDRETIEKLTERLKSYVEQSNDYAETQEVLARYREKVARMEDELKQQTERFTSAALRNQSLDLINAMHEDPLHINLTREDWEVLFKCVEQIFPSFMSRLRTLRVTRHELEICCLIRLRFERQEMLSLFHCTSEALTKSRNRLKKRLELAEGRDLEDFLLHL